MLRKFRNLISKDFLNPKKPKESQFNDKLWSSNTEFDETWKNRIALMASYIDIPGSVADFGCGMMWLESFLKEDNSYIPIDYIKRDDRTIVLDLNNNSISQINADIAFLSGVLEYVKDPQKFIFELTDIGFKKIIISYCTLEKFGSISARSDINWVSHESIFSLLTMFTVRYTLTAIDDVNGNTILAFTKKI
jgi:hypothetical protein